MSDHNAKQLDMPNNTWPLENTEWMVVIIIIVILKAFYLYSRVLN